MKVHYFPAKMVEYKICELENISSFWFSLGFYIVTPFFGYGEKSLTIMELPKNWITL